MSVSDLNEKYLVIVNPNAGKGKGEKDWKQISGLLKKESIIFESVFTKERHHAISISRENIEKGYFYKNESYVCNFCDYKDICPKTEI